jgi:hypothetical protein
METLLNVFLYIHSTIVNLSYKSNIIIMMVTTMMMMIDDDKNNNNINDLFSAYPQSGSLFDKLSTLQYNKAYSQFKKDSPLQTLNS